MAPYFLRREDDFLLFERVVDFLLRERDVDFLLVERAFVDRRRRDLPRNSLLMNLRSVALVRSKSAKIKTAKTIIIK